MSYNHVNVPRSVLLLATAAAYLPASSFAALASRPDLPGGAADPALVVVPFCLGFAAAFPAWGRAADRWSASAVVRCALIALAAAGLLVALAGGAAMLAIGRALQGLAAAGVPPAVQTEMARASSEARAGRALSGMMVAVALATLVGPALAQLLGARLGWAPAAAALGVALPLALVPLLGRQPKERAAPIVAGRSAAPPAGGGSAAPCALGGFAALPADGDRRGVRAGWAVSALVLAGQWTVLTRLGEALGPGGLGAPSVLVAGASLTGVLGLPLVLLAARACDRRGPRRPMVATLLAGAAGFALASAARDAVMFVLAAGLGLVVYWAYLPVVAVQVQRSAAAARRGRAAGGLYASMWGAAAAGGAAASLAPSWRVVLLAAGAAWASAAAIAARAFIPGPAPASSAPWSPSPRPSPR